MSEYMGNIAGQYEAKPGGFAPGAGSLHSIMAAHGPDAEAFKKATHATEDPVMIEGALAFMFETSYLLKLTPFAAETDLIDQDYYKCWEKLESHFTL